MLPQKYKIIEKSSPVNSAYLSWLPLNALIPAPPPPIYWNRSLYCYSPFTPSPCPRGPPLCQVFRSVGGGVSASILVWNMSGSPRKLLSFSQLPLPPGRVPTPALTYSWGRAFRRSCYIPTQRHCVANSILHRFPRWLICKNSWRNQLLYIVDTVVYDRKAIC